ncbi:hypothetical protein [Salibacterium salarium]|nr:hypothetical protein [Salibacterium salarium]
MKRLLLIPCFIFVGFIMQLYADDLPVIDSPSLESSHTSADGDI